MRVAGADPTGAGFMRPPSWFPKRTIVGTLQWRTYSPPAKFVLKPLGTILACCGKGPRVWEPVPSVIVYAEHFDRDQVQRFDRIREQRAA